MSTPAVVAPAGASNVTPLPNVTPVTPRTTTTTTTTSRTSSSTTTRARARTREAVIVAKYWTNSTGIRCSPAIMEEISDHLMNRHFTVEELTYAIDETTMAPRPSWSYCRAILRRLAADAPY